HARATIRAPHGIRRGLSDPRRNHDMVRQRPDIAALPLYKQGKSPSGDAVKLSSNENPYPPLPSVRDAVARRLDRFHLYPAMATPEIAARVAERHGVTPENLAFGAGS